MILRDAVQINNQANLYKMADAAICLASGAFDWFHYGHLRYLLDARALPYLLHKEEKSIALFVAINSDISYAAYKHKQPVFPLEERAFMLDSIRGVDAVVPFNDPDPRNVIDIICPDYYVKGNEYKLEDLPEKEELEKAGTIFIPRVTQPNYRTSDLLSRGRNIE